jgi:DNA polymerase I
MSSTSQGKPERHLYLVDGSGYIFRAYHALPPLSRADGTPTGAVAGFCNMLNKLVEDAEADPEIDLFCVVFDAARKTFRNDIYAEYKANRPPPPEDLVPQFALIKDASRAFNLATVEMPGFEADDVIATYARLAREQGVRVTIVSSDKDLMQLVRDGVEMLDPMKSRRIGPAEVVERFGVGPDKVVEVQALAGDSTDNVPGVPGIGVKTAAQLIEEYGDLETLLARAEEIKQPKRRQNLIEHAEMARVSRKLVELKDDVPVPYGVEQLALKPADPEVLGAFLAENELSRLLARVQAKHGAAGSMPATAMAAGPAPDPTARAYSLVDTLEALEGWIARARAAGYLAFDTETTSLDAMAAALVGCSMALLPGEACYVPLGHRGARAEGTLDLGDGAAAPRQIPLEQALARLKPLLEAPDVLKIGQNIKYDALVLKRYGIEVAPVDDTMLLSYVTEGGLHGHGMDELSELHLGVKPIPFKEVAGSGKTAISFAQVPLDKAMEYAAEDADITLQLYGVLKPRLLAQHMVTVYETLERPLIPVLVEMEHAGVRVDPAVLSRLSGDFAQRMGGLEEEIKQLAGEDFNIGSPKQLGEILFEKMSLPGGRKGKTGAWGTGADVLEDLAAQGHDLPARVLDWRQLSKLKSTYTDALQTQINPETRRVHTSYAMAATSTGRLASTDPNLQNIPVRTEEGRKIRRAFVAAEGCKLVSADYSQIELRVLAHIADIEALKQAFRDGHDIHAMTASQVFGVPMEKMDAATRRSAKAINFGIIYGISAFGLARNLAIPQGEAKAYIDAYFERYPGIRDYMERTKGFCRQHGYVETLFGRRIHMPGINEKNPARRNFHERAAINAPIQGSAADIIRRAMVRIPGALEAARLGARMLLQVHDELIFDVPEAEVEATRALVARVMSAAAHLEVPLIVDTGVGDNWDQAH